MFYWSYRSPQRSVSSMARPTILWLQGGPVRFHVSIYLFLPEKTEHQLNLIMSLSCLFQGGSGVGRGNFLEIGPLDVNLRPRNSTWLRKADLIFVVSEPYYLQ